MKYFLKDEKGYVSFNNKERLYDYLIKRIKKKELDKRDFHNVIIKDIIKKILKKDYFNVKYSDIVSISKILELDFISRYEYLYFKGLEDDE